MFSALLTFCGFCVATELRGVTTKFLRGR